MAEEDSGAGDKERESETNEGGGTRPSREIKFSFGKSGSKPEKYKPESEGMKVPWKTIALIIILLPFLYILAVYGIAYAEEPSVQRAITYFSETIPNEVIEFWRDIANPEGKIGTIWETEANQSKSGIIFKNFKLLTFTEKSMPPGQEWDFAFEFETKNVDAFDIPVTLACHIKDKDTKGEDEGIEGEILPGNPLTDIGRKNPICRFTGEQTEKLKGEKKPVIVSGNAYYPFETKDVNLKVYFTYFDNYYECKKKGYRDFFECYGMPERNPIRALYNGEPVEVAIGIGAEEEEQPVVLTYSDSAEGTKTYPTIGILLTNEWNGKVKELTYFEFLVPEGIEIDEDISYSTGSPTIVCPFVYEGQTEIEGERYNKYAVSSEYLNDVNFKQAVTIETSKKFICYLKADNGFVDAVAEKSWDVKGYRVSVGYIYQAKEKSLAVSIIKEGEALEKSE